MRVWCRPKEQKEVLRDDGSVCWRGLGVGVMAGGVKTVFALKMEDSGF